MSNILGLQKKLELDNGASAEFWRISGVVYSERDAQANVFLSGWISKEVHDAGKQPIAFVKVDLSQPQTDVIRQTLELPTKDLLAGLVLQTEQYKDAETVMRPPPATPAAPLPKRGRPKA